MMTIHTQVLLGQDLFKQSFLELFSVGFVVLVQPHAKHRWPESQPPGNDDK